MQIKRSTIDRLFQLRGLTLDSLLRFEVRDVARWLMYLGMILMVYGSLNPWPLWPIYRYYQLFAFFPVVLSLLLAHRLKHPLYTRQDYIYPTLTCALLYLVMALCSGRNLNGVFMVAFTTTIFFALFRLNIDDLRRLGDVLTKSLAILMALSIPFYIIYLLHIFPLPHHHVAVEGFDYSYENYYFFLVDDRFYMELIPRFNSITLEPSHIGMTCISLLCCQIGKWNTWRCRILFVALAMTFSLTAYVCALIMFFLAAWMKGKAIIGKIVLLSTVLATIAIGSIFYNRGDNLVNTLIVQRLTINEEGKLEGDNRTTKLFTREFDKMMQRGEWITGKPDADMTKFGFGNTGYRVYIYMYGVVSVIFLLLFYSTFAYTSPNRRAALCAIFLAFVTFIPKSITTTPYFLVPIYIMAFSPICPPKAIKANDGSH